MAKKQIGPNPGPTYIPGYSTAEVLEIVGISRATLFGWVKRGLLSAPHVYAIPGGRGREARWSEGHVQLAERLKAASGRGVPLELLRHRIKAEDYRQSNVSHGEAARIAEAWRLPNSGAKLAPQIGLPETSSMADCFGLYIERMATPLMGDKIGRVSPASKFYLAQAIYTFLTSGDPVLVVTDVKLTIVPRVMLPLVHLGDFDVIAALRPPVERSVRTARNVTVVHVFEPAPPAASGNWNHAAAFVSIELSPILRVLWAHSGFLPLTIRTFEHPGTVRERTPDGLLEYDTDVTALQNIRGNWSPDVDLWGNAWALDVDLWSVRLVRGTEPPSAQVPKGKGRARVTPAKRARKKGRRGPVQK